MPYTVENELTDVGHGILAVADAVEAWLERAPQGPIAFGSEPAKGAIRALVAGWDSTMLRALAARPLSLTELDNVISEISYPAIERRLSAMRAAKQVEASFQDGNPAKPYAVTEWARQAVRSLVAAGRCECEHLAEAADPLTRLDVEAAFLLAAPLAALPATANGACLLAVSADDQEDDGRLIGVDVDVARGKVVSCSASIGPESRSWAKGPVESWTAAILEGPSGDLELGGENVELARALVEGMHDALP
jgi:DNA-binding HxlR family transcriptional regulator